MPYVFGGSSGGGGGQLPVISFQTSRTWTPAYDLTAYVYVIGSGGAGAAVKSSNGNAGGGGAGGCAVSKLDLKSGTTYTIGIGTAGAASDANGAAVAGGNGNPTTFTDGSGVISEMTGNGGIGGIGSTSASPGATTGAAGGTATGGTLGNFTGGKGGGFPAGTINYGCAGGGAVGLWQNGNDAEPTISVYGYSSPGATMGMETGDISGQFDYQKVHGSSSGTWAYAAWTTVEPFTGIFTTEQLDETTLGSYNAHLYGNEYRNRYSGGYSEGSPTNRGYLHSSSHWYGGISAPFQGAKGVSDGTVYGQKGTAGGGGGGTFAYSTATRSGAGGRGIVLVFPISLGA